MKHLTLFAAVVGLMGWQALTTQAAGRSSCAGIESFCQEPVQAPAKKEMIPPPAAAPAAAQPCVYERTYTCYKPVMKERDVQVVICKLVPREEKFSYTVSVPVWKNETRKETFCVPVQKEVAYTCTVMVPVTTAEKRTVRECNLVQKEENYTCTVYVPKTVQQKRVVCYPEIQRTMVECVVPVCRTVPVQCTDACGNCYTTCQRVIEQQKVMREVCTRVMKTKEVLVNVCIAVPEQRVAKRIVCVPVYNEKVITVNVTRCVPEQRQIKGYVCEMVPQTRDVAVKVMHCVPEQRTGVRTVYSQVQETVTRKVTYCEMVPFTQVERIPVICGGCGYSPAPCRSCCH